MKDMILPVIKWFYDIIAWSIPYLWPIYVLLIVIAIPVIIFLVIRHKRRKEPITPHT